MRPAPILSAWRPAVAGVSEVLHGYFPDHAYPPHTHDTWTLLLVDAGTVRFELGGREHETGPSMVTLLPPGVPHDGRGVTHGGFRKRVAYLEAGMFEGDLIGRCVDRPSCTDPALRRQVHDLHYTMHHPSDAFEAECRLALITEVLTSARRERPTQLGAPDRGPGRGRAASGRSASGPQARDTSPQDSGVAGMLREVLDANVVTGITLERAAGQIGAHPTHLIRAFRRRYGIPPHRYLTSRRLDRARKALLAGKRPAQVAVEVGFHDQAHLTRHFVHLLGVTPGVYATGGRAASRHSPNH